MSKLRTKSTAFQSSRQQRFRLYTLGTAGLIALTLGIQHAKAQDSVEEVMVTGSRIVQDGYSAPTPVTVIGEAAIMAEAPANLADFVNKLPSVVGSTTPNTSQGSLSAGTAGLNALNLRALGTNRTLVLLNGHRSSASASTGQVDINTFPQELVSRVDVVTGGASADYGSDAVGGVVNFILDTKYTGFKGGIEYGETARGEGANYKASMTYGTEFAGGRGHALLSGQVYTDKGILGNGRAFNNSSYFRIQNPAYTATNGQPFYLIGPGLYPSQTTPGGLVVSGALQGTYFGVNASVNKLAYGAVSGPWMVGGDGGVTGANYLSSVSLSSTELRQNIFGRVGYEIFPGVEGYVQASYSKWHGKSLYMADWANVGGVTIQRDNAFLPASVASQLAAGQTLTIGTTNSGLPPPGSNNNRSVMRVGGGLTGSVSLWDTDWKWDLFGQNSTTELHEQTLGNWNTARMAAAQDAVRAAAGNAAGIPAGTIVCRSTLTAPTNGCVPLSRIGINGGLQSAADFQSGIAYIAGAEQPYRDETLEQQSFSFNVTGSPFENWAGPVSFAFGAEWRKEAINGVVDPQYRSGWLYGNYLVNRGHYSVAETYLETAVPLATGLDVNGSFRYTAYSTSGGVNTWKVGGNYSPVDDIRFRVTYSHDIRAPNLDELFAAGTARANTVLINNISYAFQQNLTGNPNLSPEAANSLGAGVVLSPRWVPGLTASIDYYNINLKHKIGSVTAQNVADLCFVQNDAAACGNIIRTGSGAGMVISTINLAPINFAASKAQGLDFDVTYAVPLDTMDWFGTIPGSLTLHGLATNYIENYTNDGFNPPTDVAGVNLNGGTPSWIYRVSATYTTDPWTFDLVGRGVSAGAYSNEWITCTTGCPTSTLANRTSNLNSIDGSFLMDATVTYSFGSFGADFDAFFSVKNVFDTAPPLVGNGPDGLNTPAYNQTSTQFYDTIGRAYRIGLRMKM